MELNRRARIVKRAPLWKRILNAPEDYLMKVENDIRALDWDVLQEGFSWPLAFGLNMLLVSVKLGYWLDDPLANVPSVLRYDRSYSSSKSLLPGFAALLAYLQYILVAISIINALWLFRSKKNYKLLHRKLDDRPSSSSVQMVELQQDVSHWSFRFPGKLIYPYISPFIRGPKPEDNRRQIWELSVWSPSILCRNLFCWYSPAQVLIMAGMSSENFHVFLPLSIMVALQVHILVSVYQSYVKDKQLIFGEVHREYNNQFVHPKLFVRKYDKQISTGTDTGVDSIGVDSTYYATSTGRRPRAFRHLSVPASSSTFELNTQSSKSPSSTGYESEEEGEEEMEEEDEVSSDDSDDGDEDSSEHDPDVEYDEEGEETAVPHPTNSLAFDDDDDDDE